MALTSTLLLGVINEGFWWNKGAFNIYYASKYLICPFLVFFGAGWDRCRQDTLDDAAPHLLFLELPSWNVLLSVGCISGMFWVHLW